MDKLKVMFDYITSNGVDHLPPATNGFPSAPESPMNGGVDHSPLATQGLPSAPDSPVNSVDHSPLAADGLPSDSDPDSPMNGVDHLPLAADGLPSAPVSPMYGVNLDGSDNNTEHNGGTHPEQESFPPSARNKKRPGHVNALRKNKKSKTETALVMQAHLDRILELAQKAQATFEKFCSRPDPLSASSIQDVMTLVRECGARCGSNEHFIATELFVNREQLEMFLTMETAEERFQWLRRKYIVKYLSSPSMGLR
uniref:Uncharacterized protein n=1 Tax=Arundo donax TaxID=35708 RepID=A0A0A9E6Y2_ARUDO